MANNITLSASVRSNLLSLQGTSNLIGRTQGRLATGLAVSSPIDDAVKFFQSKSLSSRANDLNERKDNIDQGVSTLKTVSEATEAVESLVEQMKGIVDSSRSGSKAEREEFASQLKELVTQVQRLVDDSSYQGLNLLNSTASSLSVRFSEKSDSKLEIDGVNFNVSNFFKNTAGGALGVEVTDADTIASKLGFTLALSAYELSAATNLALFNDKADTVIKNLEQTITNLRAKAATIGTNAAILQVRLDFTDNYVNVLQEGSDKLVLADLNEEGANLLALQTRQQLGVQALSFAGQAEQSILGLFR